MNENEFELDGEVYAAIDGDNCRDCDMWSTDECMCNVVNKMDFVFPSCNNSQCKDGKDVIFVEKQS